MTFNSNQARDNRGRWTSGGQGPTHSAAIDALPKMHALSVVNPNPQPPQPVEPLGQENEPSKWRDNAKVPSVNWESQDLQDTGKSVNEDTIKRDYVAAKDRNDVDVYKSWVPMEDIPPPQLVEEQPGEDKGGYDWQEYSTRGSFPPVKLEVDKDGKVAIVDGNHRTRFFEEQGYTHVPAYVIDHRKNVKHDGDDE